MRKKIELSDWITQQTLRGRYMFTKADLLAADLTASGQALQNSLFRLTERGVIMSPWQNFYVIIPTEYKLRGIVPPSFYIDHLMKFLRRDYYVSLLSAASLNGAAHQRAQVFQVTVNGKPLRSGVKNGTHLVFTQRQNIPFKFITQIKTQTGYMNVSGPELTALDVVAEEKKIGGISRAAEIISELAPQTRWNANHTSLLDFFSAPAIQRLGFLLDYVEEKEKADALYSLVKATGKVMRKIPIKQSACIADDMNTDNRWKIINNYKIEIDEI